MNKKDIQALQKGLKNFSGRILDLIYPRVCILCGSLTAEGLCAKCKKDYPIIGDKRCMCCSKFIGDKEKEYCQDCMKIKKHFIQGASLWRHSGKVKQSIYRFKYKNHRVYAKDYAKLFLEIYGDKIIEWEPKAIIGVPVHSSRKRERGYNQAQILARSISCEIEALWGVKIPEITHYVYRKKNTGFQKVLDDKQRVKNLQGVFHVRKGVDLPDTVLIVDDIYTTGATLNELVKILKKHGVMEAYFLCISIGQGV